MADPDAVVGIDPRTTMNFCQVASRCGERLGNRNGGEVFGLLKGAVGQVEERLALPFVMLPGVLSVEDDRDDRLRNPVSNGVLTDAANLGDKVGRRVLAFHARVGEPDAIAELVIAEENG